MSKVCSICGEFKHTPWRDGDGYICAGCLGKERDSALARVAELEAKIQPYIDADDRRVSLLRIAELERDDLRDKLATENGLLQASLAELLKVGQELETLRAKPRFVSETHEACHERIDELLNDKDRLLDAIDKDATGLAAALGAIKQAIVSRSWVTESRGCYSWDDDKYKEETYDAFKAVLDVLDPALQKSGTIANQAWREFEGGRILKLRAEVRRLRQVALEFGTRVHTPIEVEAVTGTMRIDCQATVGGTCLCGAGEHNQRLQEALKDVP